MCLPRTNWILGIVLLTLAGPPSCSPDHDRAVEPLPNFIILLCDDLAYQDIGPFGSTNHRTPHLNRMAAEGRKFTSFYVTAGLCTPSRSSLMTGSYPRRVGLHKNEQGRGVLSPGNTRGLSADEITIAEILSQRGYATGIVGKWHLGDQPEFLPTRHGFDYFFGLPYSNDQGQDTFPQYGFPPLPLLRNDEVIEGEPDQAQLTRRYTEEAIQFITKHKDSPFFLYLSHAMPHYPFRASEAFRGKSADGIYGDVIEEIDWSTGQVLEAVQELGIDDRTLVIFLSDNGGAARRSHPLRGGKASTWEGGLRVPCIMRWPGRIPTGTISGEVATTMDLLPTLAKLAGGAPPPDRIIDGKDIRSLMLGEEGAASPHDRFYYYQVGSLAAIRSGKWKLHLGRFVRREGKSGWESTLELYDLDADIGETVNLADEHPEVVEQLRALAEEARQDLGDDATGQTGENTRPPGEVQQARTLTTNR